MKEWSELIPLAQRAPEEMAEMPFGFDTRVLAALKENECEQTVALQWGLRALLLSWCAAGVMLATFQTSAPEEWTCTLSEIQPIYIEEVL